MIIFSDSFKTIWELFIDEKIKHSEELERFYKTLKLRESAGVEFHMISFPKINGCVESFGDRTRTS